MKLVNENENDSESIDGNCNFLSCPHTRPHPLTPPLLHHHHPTSHRPASFCLLDLSTPDARLTPHTSRFQPHKTRRPQFPAPTVPQPRPRSSPAQAKKPIPFRVLSRIGLADRGQTHGQLSFHQIVHHTCCNLALPGPSIKIAHATMVELFTTVIRPSFSPARRRHCAPVCNGREASSKPTQEMTGAACGSLASVRSIWCLDEGVCTAGDLGNLLILRVQASCISKHLGIFILLFERRSTCDHGIETMNGRLAQGTGLSLLGYPR